MNKIRKLDRRQFLKLGMKAGGSAVALSAIPIQLLAQDAVTESEPLAQAMGYVEDATKTDTAKFPKRAGEAGAELDPAGAHLEIAGDRLAAADPAGLHAEPCLSRSTRARTCRYRLRPRRAIAAHAGL